MNYEKLLWIKINSLNANNSSRKIRYIVRDSCSSALLVFIASLLFFRVGNLFTDILAIVGVILAIILSIICFRKLKQCDKEFKKQETKVLRKYKKKVK